MPKTLTFTYGEKSLPLEFTDAFLAGDLVQPKPSAGSMDEEQLAAKIEEALANPIGRPRLKEMAAGKSVALVISDEFRAGLQRLILDRMLKEIHDGGPTRIGVFISTGSHDPKFYAANIRDWFKESCERHGIHADLYANDCDQSEHIYLGKTSLGSQVEIMKDFLEFEVRAYGHESKHHYMNGYSVIDKQVAPGLASRETIAQTHKGALDSEHSWPDDTPSTPIPPGERTPSPRATPIPGTCQSASA